MAEFKKLSEVEVMNNLTTETNVLVEDAGDVRKLSASIFKHKVTNDDTKGVILIYELSESSSSSGSSSSSSGDITYKFVLAKSVPIYESEEAALNFFNGKVKAYDYYGDELTLLTAKQVYDYVSDEGYYVADGFYITSTELEATLAEKYPNYYGEIATNVLVDILYTQLLSDRYLIAFAELKDNSVINYRINALRGYNDSSVFGQYSRTFTGGLDEWL